MEKRKVAVFCGILGRCCSRALTRAVVVSSLAVPGALASPIVYIFTGTSSGTLGAVPFSGAQVTLTGFADTDEITALAGIPSLPCVPLRGVIVEIAGIGSANAIGPNVMFDSQVAPGWGFLNGYCGGAVGNWFANVDPLAATYALATSIGPSTGTPSNVGSTETTAGELTFSAAPLTFRAALGPTSAIPTLNGIGLSVLGLLLVALTSKRARHG